MYGFRSMSPVWRTLKSVFLWSYGRATWQYDVFCVLILAFIFLTPKHWFTQSQPETLQLHQNRQYGAVKLLIWPDTPGHTPDRQELERRARLATGRPEARVTRVREVLDPESGRTALEVDIE